MIELSFYWSLIFSQFVDVQRKDFWVNFIHHIATVLLMSFSWADNFCRVGTLVLLIHDAVDFWLEAAKMARYCKKNNICNILFIVFTATWFLTRCMIYPFWIIYSTLVEAPAFILFYRAYYVFNFLLFLLLILHIFWSIMILKIALSAVRSGEADDARSDSEDETDDTSSVSSNGKVKKT
jgi:ceramide synthetase